jgi:ATP-binding cassette subfamily F protein 3
LNPAHSAYDHVRELMPDAPEARIRARVGGLGFPRSKMDTPARDLSGGEKARLLMGLATFSGANLLILDEPTNHLDIDSREALVQALAEFSGAVILISHDRHLVEASVDRLWLVAGGTVRSYDGDLDEYRRSVLESRSAGASGSSGKSRPDQEKRRAAAQKRNDTAPLRRRIRDIEARMDRIQKELGEIDEKLGNPALYARNPMDAAFLSKARADAARKLAAAEEEWFAANAEFEQLAAE